MSTFIVRLALLIATVGTLGVDCWAGLADRETAPSMIPDFTIVAKKECKESYMATAEQRVTQYAKLLYSTGFIGKYNYIASERPQNIWDKNVVIFKGNQTIDSMQEDAFGTTAGNVALLDSFKLFCDIGFIVFYENNFSNIAEKYDCKEAYNVAMKKIFGENIFSTYKDSKGCTARNIINRCASKLESLDNMNEISNAALNVIGLFKQAFDRNNFTKTKLYRKLDMNVIHDINWYSTYWKIDFLTTMYENTFLKNNQEIQEEVNFNIKSLLKTYGHSKFVFDRNTEISFDAKQLLEAWKDYYFSEIPDTKNSNTELNIRCVKDYRRCILEARKSGCTVSVQIRTNELIWYMLLGLRDEKLDIDLSDPEITRHFKLEKIKNNVRQKARMISLLEFLLKENYKKEVSRIVSKPEINKDKNDVSNNIQIGGDVIIIYGDTGGRNSTMALLEDMKATLKSRIGDPLRKGSPSIDSDASSNFR